MVDVLFVTDRRFWRRSIGSEQRIAALVRYLARRGLRVSTAYVGRIRQEEKAGLEVFRSECPGLEIHSRSTDLRSLASGMRRIARRARDSMVARGRESRSGARGPAPFGASSERRRFVQRTIRALRPRVVVVELLRLADTVPPSRPGGEEPEPIYVVDTHDVLHRRNARYRAEGFAIDRPISASEESRLLARFDWILAIQSEEGRLLREMLPGKEILVVPHGIEMPAVPDSVPAPGARVRIGFLGGRDESNRRSIEWFTEEIWPALRARFADRIELRVGGHVCHACSVEGPGIVRLGTLEHVRDFWPGIDIAINPVRFGSGLKIKNVEALAFGVALVTTSIGAEGFMDEGLPPMIVADGRSDWIDALERLVADEGRRRMIADRGRAFAERRLDEDVAFGPFADRLETLRVRD